MASEHAHSQPVDPGANLAQGLHRQSRIRPDALAVACQGRELSYLQLSRQAAGLARALQSHPRWPAGDAAPRVGILGSRSIEACVAVLGTAWTGATYVPLGLKLPEERILAILAMGGLSALVVDTQGARLLSDKVLQAAPPIVLALGPEPPIAGPGVEWLDPAVLGAGVLQAPVRVAPQHTAYIIFTSGTTGAPKGVVVRADAVRHYIRTVSPLLGMQASDRALESCELSFDVAGHNMFCTWEAGASLHILPATRAMSAVSFAREHGLTVWNSVPSLVGMLRQLKALGPGALPALRFTMFGGEQLTRSIVETWRAAAPNSAIVNLYGPTEATIFCLAQAVHEPLPLSPGRDVVSIGKPMAGSEAVVLDAAGEPVADGTPGELALGGVQLATGYLDAPALTASRFVTLRGIRWYLTGDLALRDAAGNFHCLGRLDNQVKVLGHRIELEEIDAHLRQVVDTGLAAAVAWPVVDGAAQGLVGFVGGTGVDEARVIQALKARLPPYMVPARVLAVDDMPVNGSGKVDRKALRQRLEAGMG